MADIIVSTKFSVGDKAIVSNETSSRKVFYIVKIVSIKHIVPDIDEAGTDIITYTVEIFAPTSTNKVRIDVKESELTDLQAFTDAFNNF
ncbi:hypothetical protein SECTIM467_77 [Brevibacillus phage SecTim467]|uniref:Uncharacterized protein n=2 Tax=Jenstvirus jenst TaxID=1982225 RepID=A0A0K2CNM6_9CAUD|nr:hypothetical protein AVV11_gp119 [Brevibacillus phage Jenst]ALA07201.1 hypothetical protein JENST_72 [Brevibacillus phage Jenst]ALA07422.1 hypothetical protein SECTIM467_77 [Brevibacillus phage SecTim467]